MAHFTLSQDPSTWCWDTSHCPKTLLLKCWDTLHCPKTTHSSVGKLRTVPRPFALVLEHFTLSQNLVLGHLVLYQDLMLNCWDTSRCPKTSHSSVGTLRTVPRPFHSSVGTLRTVPRPFHSSVGTLRTVPRPFHSSVGTLRSVPRPYHSSVGTLRTVPTLPSQLFRLLVLTPEFFVTVLGQSDLFFIFGVGTLRSLSPVPPLES